MTEVGPIIELRKSLFNLIRVLRRSGIELDESDGDDYIFREAQDLLAVITNLAEHSTNDFCLLFSLENPGSINDRTKQLIDIDDQLDDLETYVRIINRTVLASGTDKHRELISLIFYKMSNYLRQRGDNFLGADRPDHYREFYLLSAMRCYERAMTIEDLAPTYSAELILNAFRLASCQVVLYDLENAISNFKIVVNPHLVIVPPNSLSFLEVSEARNRSREFLVKRGRSASAPLKE